MRLGLDTNVLVYAHMPAFREHEAVRSYLLERLKEPRTTIVLTPLVLHELVHAITDARRFTPPVTMAEALAVAQGYLRRANVEIASVDGDAWRLAAELLARHRLGRKRIADTLLVATLVGAGVGTLVTCDADDYRVLGELALVDPRKG